MVFIIDEGSEFEAPIEKVWKLNEAHLKDAGRIHPGGRNYKTENISDSTTTTSLETDIQGQSSNIKIKITKFYPLGVAIELLEGPMTGSKFFNYYIPNKNKTGVTVVGDFKSPIINDEAQLRQTVLSFLEQAFKEDSTYLKKMV
jgi:hypothetical protein